MKELKKELKKKYSENEELKSKIENEEFEPIVIKEGEGLSNTGFISAGRPNKAQTDLIDRYKVDGEVKVVPNNIKSYIKENLEHCIDIIRNMIDYGDAKIYKMLPELIDKEVKEKALEIQQYCVREDLKEGTKVVIFPEDYVQCTCCGKYKKRDGNNFLQNKTIIYKATGFLTVCKDCMQEIVKHYLDKYKDVRETLIVLCQKFDTIVYEPALKKTLKEFEERSVEITIDGDLFSRYLYHLRQDKTSVLRNEDRGFEVSNFSGIPFKVCMSKTIMPPIYNDKLVQIIEEDEDEIKLTKKEIRRLKDKWGEFDEKTLSWLERKYEEWHSGYEIKGKSREILVIQMCIDEYEIFKARANGQDVSKNLSSLQLMMKNSELSPKLQANSAIGSSFESLGEFIKKVETTKPIIHKNPLFVDVDGIRKLWISIAGAIARTLGKSNDLTEKFEEYYKEHTVDFTSMVDGEENEPEQ